MRCEHHAAGVPAPVFHVQRRIVLRQEGIAAVTEDALDKIKVAHQIAGREEADLHALLRRHAGNGGADQRAHQQRDEHVGGFSLVHRVWQGKQVFRRVERMPQKLREHLARYRLLVAGNRQAALCNVE